MINDQGPARDARANFYLVTLSICTNFVSNPTTLKHVPYGNFSKTTTELMPRSSTILQTFGTENLFNSDALVHKIVKRASQIQRHGSDAIQFRTVHRPTHSVAWQHIQ